MQTDNSKKPYIYPDNIVPAGTGKIVGGFVIDGAITMLLFATLYFTAGPAISANMGANDIVENVTTYVSETKFIRPVTADGGLTCRIYSYTGDDGNIGEDLKISKDYEIFDGKYVGKYAYEAYEDIIWSFYTGWSLTGNNCALVDNKGTIVSDVEKTTNSYGKWTYENIFGLVQGSPITPASYFTYALDGEQINYNVAPALNPSNEVVKKLSSSDENEVKTAAATLASYFYNGSSSSPSGLYYDGYQAFMAGQPYYNKLYKQASQIAYIARLPAVIIAPLLAFLILPLCIPEGRSLGKLLMKTAVIGADGYSAPKWRILIHCLLATLPWYALLIPNMMLGFMTMVIVWVISYILLYVDKRHQSIHERIAGTLTIDYAASTYFGCKEDEETYIRNNPDSAFAKSKEEKKEDEFPTSVEAALAINKDLTSAKEDEPASNKETVDLTDTESTDVEELATLDLEQSRAEKAEEPKQKEPTPVDEDEFLDKK